MQQAALGFIDLKEPVGSEALKFSITSEVFDVLANKSSRHYQMGIQHGFNEMNRRMDDEVIEMFKTGKGFDYDAGDAEVDTATGISAFGVC